MNSCNQSGMSERDGFPRASSLSTFSLGFWISVGSCNVFLRASLFSLSHRCDAGLGIEPSISCDDDVGVVGVHELDGEEPVVKLGTTIGT